ncbi:Fe(3+)-hydroxamate ABC transporter permease FhuB [Ochrobactrum teleogrylli]|uniref:Fe(3+)-hydroxamate ABC transporter permease FhuB n=1 Tax=Ochrobactrum teleogrylli TaxID=2479765 RepID=A0ABY2Y2I5_9HYPH|nr:Fe(3+)-hydroxamate ABC transporter permease FhuB [[Ochrobactrum] teleogrylli]TNV11889.1 Fe(3+)-hydroxamate ABC transporter permease FhuB [[Ochrobactrum] teleogrylli]
MSGLETTCARPRKSSLRWIMLAFSVACVALLIVQGFLSIAKPAEWLHIITAPNPDDPRHVIGYYSFLPRLAVGLLVGGALGLGGAVFQTVLRNPLAEPGLLGVASGAQIALAFTLVFAPGLWIASNEAIAIIGAGMALSLSLFIASRGQFSSTTVVLAGLMVGLYCNAIFSLLVLFNHDYLINLLTWQAGSLQQGGWEVCLYLLPRLLPLAVLIFILQRPLNLLSLGDNQAKGLGISPAMMRLVLLAAAAATAAVITSSLGLIGMIGLAAPNLARAFAPGQDGRRLVWSALLGALLLVGIDQLLRAIAPFVGNIPAGAATGLFTGPILVILASRVRLPGVSSAQEGTSTGKRLQKPLRLLFALSCALAFCMILSVLVSNTPDGWSFAAPEAVTGWRGPRIFAAAGAGICLAVAGLVLQGTLRNTMASPDLLGIGYGAGFGLAIAVLFMGDASGFSKLAVATFGALVVLSVIAGIGWRTAFQPERVLLIGVGLGSMFHALMILLLASGNPRVAGLLNWFSGSMGNIGWNDAALGCICATIVLLAALLFRRPLDIFPLGDVTVRSVGLKVSSSRAILLAIAGLGTTAATITVGPVSFIGLMVPHFAAMLGFRGVTMRLLASALLGALLLVFADWLGRNLAYPWPMSAGLLASLIGGGFFLRLLSKSVR